MDYLGDKLTVAHTQVTDWVGSVRRSLQGALTFVSSSMDRSRGGEEGGGFKRTSSLRSLASRSRESFRRFSVRSRQQLRSRLTPTSPANTPNSVRMEHAYIPYTTHKVLDIIADTATVFCFNANHDLLIQLRFV